MFLMAGYMKGKVVLAVAFFCVQHRICYTPATPNVSLGLAKASIRSVILTIYMYAYYMQLYTAIPFETICEARNCYCYVSQSKLLAKSNILRLPRLASSRLHFNQAFEALLG